MKKIHVTLCDFDGLSLSDFDSALSQLNENDMREQKIINFCDVYCNYLNYYQKNQATAFGDPEYFALGGWINGYVSCANGKIETLNADADKVIIYGYQILFDKPRMRP